MKKRLRSRILSLGIVGTSLFGAFGLPAMGQDMPTASQLLDRGSALLDKKEYAEAKKVLLTINPVLLPEEQRPKLDALLKQADQAIATSDKSGAAMDEAKAAMDNGNLAVAARGYEAVASDDSAPAATRDNAKIQLALVKEKQKAVAPQMKELLTQAVASYDGGRLDESQNALNTIEASGADLGDDSAKVSKYQKLIAEKRVAMTQTAGGSTAVAVTTPAAPTAPMAPAVPLSTTGPSTPMGAASNDSILDEQIKIEKVQHDRALVLFQSDMRQSADYFSKKDFVDALNSAKNANVDLTTSRQFFSSVDYNTFAAQAQGQINSSQAALEAQRLQSDISDADSAAKREAAIAALQQKSRDEQVMRLVAEAKEAYDLQRYDQAEAVLQQATNIDPRNDLVAFNLLQVQDKIKWQDWQKVHIKRSSEMMSLQVNNYEAVIPYNELMIYPDNWPEISRRRLEDTGSGESDASRRLRDRLDAVIQPPELTADNQALEKVLNYIREQNNVNMIVNWTALGVAGVEKTTPVTINLRDVSLRTALTVVLQSVNATTPLDIATVDGVIHISTKTDLATLASTKYVQQSYDVRDLIVPAPTVNNNTGIGSSSNFGSNNTQGGIGGQQGGIGGIGGQQGGIGNQQQGGIGQQGGNQQNNQQSNTQVSVQDQNRQIRELIDLISSSIEPSTWHIIQYPGVPLVGGSTNGTGGGGGGAGGGAAGGGGGGRGGGAGGGGGGGQSQGSSSVTNDAATGQGSIAGYNTSLIVSQTPEIQTEVASLLQILRQDQSLQVSIECRFLLVDNNFLDDFGLDWQLSFPAGQLGGSVGAVTIQNGTSSIALPAATSIPGSFGGAATNTIGTTAAATGNGGNGGGNAVASALTNPLFSPNGNALTLGTTFGGLLDSFQASLLIRASQVSARTTSLSAPRVTMLSGESAHVGVTTTSEVIGSITPGQSTLGGNGVAIVSAPTVNIQPITDGITLDVTAAVSGDRRYVIMSLSPNLSKISKIQQVAINGGTDAQGNPIVQDISLVTEDDETVSTKVSVPDGGTLMIGGTKLLEESEVEAGVPILSKIPIINRLFTNRTYVKDERTLLILLKPKVLIHHEIEVDRFGRSYDAPNTLIPIGVNPTMSPVSPAAPVAPAAPAAPVAPGG